MDTMAEVIVDPAAIHPGTRWSALPRLSADASPGCGEAFGKRVMQGDSPLSSTPSATGDSLPRSNFRVETGRRCTLRFHFLFKLVPSC